MEKLISVIVPIYNVEKYLKKCIESILAQSYTNFEVWLIDDGSTDKSLDICKDYEKKDRRIKVVHKINGGLSSARNIGIDYARGEYISFIDSDDYINKEFLRELYRLCENENCDIAQCDFLYTSENSIKLKEQDNALIKVMTGKEAVIKCCDSNIGVNYNVAWNKLYRKQLFCGIRYPEGKIHEDEFTTYKLFAKADRVVITDKYLYSYLQRSDSIMGKLFDERRLVRLEAYKERLRFLKENGYHNIYDTFLISYFRSIWGYYEEVKKNIVNNQKILHSLEEESGKIIKEILDLPNKSTYEKVRIVYKYLPDKEKELYRKMFGNLLYINNKEEYIFPYSLIPYGTRIALYGAGSVGKAYYKQIITMKYADIAIWVDNRWNSFFKNGFPVESIDSLLRKEREYDYVVLAIKNMDMALLIQKNLVSWGISPSKIIWHYPVMLSEKDSAYIQKERRRIKQIASSVKDRVILMNTPNHGNLGDHALAIAAEKFIKENFSTYEMVEFTGRQWDFCKKEIIEFIRPNDVIFFVGGGYMGDIWPKESNRIKEIMFYCKENIKVFLPQTFYYENIVTSEEKEIFLNAKKTLYIHRENISKRNFVKNIVEKEYYNRIYPDMVLGLNVQIEKERKGVYLCFRSDKESVVSNKVKNIIREYLEHRQIYYDMIDTVVPWNIEPEFRKEEVNKFLEKISEKTLFITDRLHGMLFALITHTPCIVFDNKTQKIEGVYEWIKNVSYIRYVKEKDFDVDIIENSMNCTISSYDFSNKFKEMSEQIKKWIEENL